MKTVWATAVAISMLSSAALADTVRVAGGQLEGTEANSIRIFKGVPYAAPPLGDLRWQPPQAVKKWEGVRRADAFGPRPMQHPIFGDIVASSRSTSQSEDCLYLNVWTPAKAGKERLPVLVYFYGGGFVAGDGSEPRYDGENMARKGMVSITVNYRLGIFGFFAHPELTKESPRHASGNYGLLDQAAALKWVHDNIAAFGGDPKRVTIAGESAGSFSVCAQMASPLSRRLIAGAIGESGAFFGATLRQTSLTDAEKGGETFASEVKAPSLADLRALPADRLMEATRANPFRFGVTIDGYFFPKTAAEIYASGEQAHVPLLAGWNGEEAGSAGILGQEAPTPEALEKAVRRTFPSRADDAVKAIYAADAAEAKMLSAALAGDQFIGYGTWKWLEMQAKTGGKPVYRYLFLRARPGETGPFHAVEIDYALGNLYRNTTYKWTEADGKVSAAMMEYFANFVKKGDPNGPGLPAWPSMNGGKTAHVMRLDVECRAEPERDRQRYLFLDSIASGTR